jgi:hypothetical protein
MTTQLTEIHDVKARLLGLSPAEFDALKNIYQYRWLKKLLRTNGWINIFLGGLTLYLGLSGFNRNLFFIIQTLLGLLILGQSLWSIASLSSANVQRYSIIFFLCGAWNIFLALVSLIGGFPGTAIIMGIFGLVQVRWGYQYRKLYQRWANVSVEKPTSEISKLHDLLWKAMTRGIIHADEDYVEVQIERRDWRGFLLPDRTILAVKQRNELLAGYKQDFIITSQSSSESSRKWLPIKVSLGVVSTTGKMQPKFFEKYSRWKQEENTDSSDQSI